MKKVFTILSITLPTITIFGQVEDCGNLPKIFERVFAIYEEQLDPQLEKFAASQYKGTDKNEVHKLILQTRVDIYREKVRVLKEKSLQQLKKQACKKNEVEAIGFVSGSLDQMFRYEFPGLDCQYFEGVDAKIAKLLIAK